MAYGTGGARSRMIGRAGARPSRRDQLKNRPMDAFLQEIIIGRFLCFGGLNGKLQEAVRVGGSGSEQLSRMVTSLY